MSRLLNSNLTLRFLFLLREPVTLLDEIGKVGKMNTYEGWNFNSGNYLFTIDTK